jgi:translocation and assembly module TamA
MVGLRAAAAPLLLCAALALAACGGGDGEQRQALDRGGDGLPRLPPVPYTVTFPDDLPPELATLLPQVSQAERDRAEPPDSRLGVRQRAEADVERLQQALRAEGYFDAAVGFTLEDAAGAPAPGLVERLERAAGTEARPQALLRFDVQPGPRYRFGELRVGTSDNPDGYVPPSPESLGLVPGEPARTETVIDAEQGLLRQAREAGFALAALGERDAVVDHEGRTMDVRLRLKPGRRASFGQVTFTGGEGIDTSFLRGRVPFAAGERFAPAPLDEGQRNLFDTDLFSTIIVRPAGELTPEGALDVTYELRQRPPRSIGAVLGYQTDLGPSARLFWEHRNFFGAGERFRVQTDLFLDQQSATVSLSKPDFPRPRVSLLTDASLRRDNFDAYKSTSVGAGVALEREFTDQLKGSLGVALRYAQIEDQEQPKEEFALLSFPGRIDWDFANDRFNPTRGGTVLLTGAPYVDLLGASRHFFKARLTHTRYFGLTEMPELVLALRGSLGSLFGASRDEVPADERFYAGGGGSIRGIAFQEAGPLDDNDDPRGGRSVAEGSVELRLRLRNDLGAVLFVDGGTVFDSSLPTGGERVLFGAGPGLRYFTPIGPLRLDVGFPLNPRKGVDDGFQLYISIGQSF